MYCPKCSKPLLTDEGRFCSQCGVPLAQSAAMISQNGETSANTFATPKQRGIHQGVVLMSLSVILIPAYILLAALFPANDRLVESSVSDTPFEKISQALLITMFMLGLARLLYALFFQSGIVATEPFATAPTIEGSTNYSLPAGQGTPVSSFGTWRETGEIVKRSEYE